MKREKRGEREGKKKGQILPATTEGSKSKVYPTDQDELLKVLREENREALEQIQMGMNKEFSPKERFENALREALSKSIKPVKKIPKTAVPIPLEVFVDQVEETTRRIVAEAKFNAVQNFVKQNRKSGAEKRKRNAEQRKQFAFSIFKQMESKGIALADNTGAPIKRSLVVKLIEPHWEKPKNSKLKTRMMPKEDTLYNLLKDYLKGKP